MKSRTALIENAHAMKVSNENKRINAGVSTHSGSKAMTKFSVGIVIVVVIIVAVYFANKKSSFANMPPTNAKTTLYYSPTCPHCVSMMPVWRQIESVHGAKVASVNVAEHPGVFAEQGLTGVPAIKKGNRVHSGPRTFADINKFVVSG